MGGDTETENGKETGSQPEKQTESHSVSRRQSRVGRRVSVPERLHFHAVSDNDKYPASLQPGPLSQALIRGGAGVTERRRLHGQEERHEGRQGSEMAGWLADTRQGTGLGKSGDQWERRCFTPARHHATIGPTLGARLGRMPPIKQDLLLHNAQHTLVQANGLKPPEPTSCLPPGHREQLRL
ncbi:hypothetical protein DPEC_G00311420 [Dallia pectoralis]|uniref:Uncharacterized protein n=1 Tax=Dallia pectoralis TaxID=75939 RepID=A0ACC2FBD3_DALPE|nr:hypothetical protein DPEC_G00311420 [Dallia pectoralis]